MTLIKAVEETCDEIYVSCEYIDKAVKMMGTINDALESETANASTNTDVSKTYHQRLYRLFSKLSDSEKELQATQKEMVKLLKKQNEILEQVERERESIKEFELY